MPISFRELDPNFIIKIDRDDYNEQLLKKELINKRIHYKSGTDNDEKQSSLYLRVDPDEDKLLDLFDIILDMKFIKNVIPIYDHETKRHISYSVEDIIKDFYRFPTENELIELTLLSGNPDIGFYFVYFNHYMKSLMTAGIGGLLIRYIYGKENSSFNGIYTLWIVLWSLHFTANWVYKLKPRYMKKLLKVQKLSIQSMKNKNNLKQENPRKSILLKKVGFLPIAIIFMAALLFCQLSCFSFEIFVTQLYDGKYTTIFSLFPPILLSIFTTVLITIYNLVFVNPFVNLENGPSPDSSRLEKNIPLLFLMNFAPLMITLFLYYPMGSTFTRKWNTEFRPMIKRNYSLPLKGREFNIDMNRHNNQIVYFTITNQVILLALDNILPIVLKKVKEKLLGSNKPTSNKSLTVSNMKFTNPTEIEYWQQGQAYENNIWGEFNVDENYKKLIIQLGFVILFSTIWPLTPLIYFMFNVIFFRADLYRSLIKCTPSSIPNNHIPPQAVEMERHSSQGSWDIILQIITWLGTIVNPLISLLYHQPIMTTDTITENVVVKHPWIKKLFGKLFRLKVYIPGVIGFEQCLLLTFVIMYKMRSSSAHGQNSLKYNAMSQIPSTTQKNTSASLQNSSSAKLETNDKDIILQKSDVSNPSSASVIGETDRIFDNMENPEDTSISNVRRRGFTLPTKIDPHITKKRSATITSADETPTSTPTPLLSDSDDTPVKHRNSIASMKKFVTKLKPHSPVPPQETEYPPPEMYVTGKYHEMNENHFPQTLRNSVEETRHRSGSLRSDLNTTPVSRNSLAATAATAALFGGSDNHNSSYTHKSIDETRKPSIKYEHVLKNITNANDAEALNLAQGRIHGKSRIPRQHYNVHDHQNYISKSDIKKRGTNEKIVKDRSIFDRLKMKL